MTSLGNKIKRAMAASLNDLVIQDFKFEPSREKTNNLGFRPGPTQTRLYSHRTKLGA